MDGDSLYNRAELNENLRVNGLVGGTRYVFGTEVIGIGTTHKGMQEEKGRDPEASGGPNMAGGTKRERVDIIPPEELPANSDQMSYRQRKDFRKRHRGEKGLGFTKSRLPH